MLMTGYDKEFDLGAGSTALTVAARHGRAGCARLLVRAGAGADVGAANAEGKTALEVAREWGHSGVVSALLELKQQQQQQQEAQRCE
jgi:ankyrin repeat protein